MTAMSDRPIRVIQWTTGNIGRRSLHAIIGRPDMDLVGVYAHGPDKVGVDAAELAGWPQPTGIAATDDIDALIAAKPHAATTRCGPASTNSNGCWKPVSTSAHPRPGSPVASSARRTWSASERLASEAIPPSSAAAHTLA
jgi:hypothetical protein